jgi:hypothetical protein
MSAAATLFKPPPALGDLTPRQRLMYDLLCKPRTDAEFGVWSHATRGTIFDGQTSLCSCVDGTPCEWAAINGRNLLTALRRRGLVVRRRSGFWERTDGSSRHEGPGEVIPF